MNEYKRKFHYIPLIIMLIGLVALFSGYCYVHNKSILTNNTQNDSIKKSIKDFYSSIDTRNSTKLMKISDKDTIFLIRTFLSGNGTRGAEIFHKVKTSKIPNKLIFSLIKGEYPIDLKTEFHTDLKDYSTIKVIKSNMNLDLHSFLIDDLLTNFTKLRCDENKVGEGTFVYILKNGSFCLAQFDGSGLQYSRWTIFQYKNNEYKIKALIIVD